ncbi:hypothetical protein APR50_31145 [Variovorax paradoxus]|mgnify:CR=1 FL=1|jgi:ferric-dicitrate binding protein FerR (iron transport regulator)|uniref:hypothetical protein n=1 Tax=Variovorax TaxID=34072 RepID=UPI0006E64DA2|nr:MULTISPECIES: hypothetical protein [unclassified Variovorax]KPU91768.1 hypothetical protein APR49_40540 [Variovorax paradoxus]KPU94109.1 hypothetical protein APR52_22375 [Variovorax paradoxus]KPV01030.1 hypothetical protein APR50_31145 [Variovorax paradoxus]KPV20596.1 hypothetical protein APR51_16465 [Variovorax paradoxus]KPV22214.1 hypothetical protein APR48_37175 [Variovorax paradoxus]
MKNSSLTRSEAAVATAWTLFSRLHDEPSRAHAHRLVTWLGEDPLHVRALDDALTLWALAGAALSRPACGDDATVPRTGLQ